MVKPMPAPALDPSYHYPPDVLELLVDTIPRLIKTKGLERNNL